jgi:hypothetical protein
VYAERAKWKISWEVHPRLREQLAIVLFLLAAAVFLFVDGRTTPIIL